MNVKYFYQNNNYNWRYENIVDKIALAVSNIIELPPILEVCIYNLGKSVYGGIDMIHMNRIGINHDLPIESVPLILTHELIHVHQKFTKVLKITRKGEFYWHGVLITKNLSESMPYDEYINLPWEYDAYSKQQEVLSKALQFLKIDK